MTIKAKNLRRVLIGVQFITAFVLIMSSWFMYLQNSYMRHADVGYDRDQIILSRVNLRILNSKNAFTNQLKSFAEIADVTYAANALSTADNYNSWSTQYNGEKIMFQWIPVDPSFIEVMNIHVSEGRGFREDDKKTGKYIFNEKAKKEFGLTLNALIDSTEIIGFIPDIQYTTFRTASVPMAFYVASGQKDYSNYAYIKVKAGSDMKAAMKHVKSVVVIAHHFISNWLENFSLQTPLHWWVFLASGLFVFIITIITVSWQSWKTATSNPLEAMRN